ncbi:MAG: hypothetical protein QGG36_07405 [Pirellulaceae bacterium]|jgi:hypothetical protein|nr:hypothetical protein [Pirellulaceae bacterium]MDP7015610.1 hypothetical protein [Pirellulaceae bacterium]
MWFVALSIALTTAPTGAGNAPFQRQAVYLRADQADRYSGQVNRIEVSLRKGEVHVWLLDPSGAFGFFCEGQGVSALLRPGPAPDVTRYVLRDRSGVELDFRDPGGDAYLPYSFARQPAVVLPHCLDRTSRFRDKFDYLGDRFELSADSSPSKSFQIGVPRTIELNDDLFLGNSRNFRDVGSGRIPLREFRRDPKLDYTYRDLDEEDLERMLKAGFNYFDRVLPNQFEFLFDKPAFFDLKALDGASYPLFPLVLYHPGFLGVEDFLDEPAYIFFEDYQPPPTMTIAEMGRLQEQRTTEQLQRKARGRMPSFSEKLSLAKIDLPGVEVAEPPLPIWEEFYSTGCYQLHAPVAGFIHEGRYQHPQVIDLLNRTFDAQIPQTPEATLHFYFAFLRGAARAFDKDWGTSIYGQADADISLLAMTMAYDRGARYLFFWSSDRDHHLPFEEQLRLASQFQEHVKRHTRGDRRELLESTQHAIVLPYGFTFSISDWKKASLAPLWQRNAFPFETGRFEWGVTYYDVLDCAADDMETLLQAGEEFDIVIDCAEVANAGYGQLHYPHRAARWRRFRFLNYVRVPYLAAAAPLVILLVVLRIRRRRRAAA